MYNVVTKQGSVLASYSNMADAQQSKDYYNCSDLFDYVTVQEADNSFYRKPTPQEEVIMEHYLKLKDNARRGLHWWNQD